MKKPTTLAALIIPLFAAAPLFVASKPAQAQLPATSADYSTTGVSWQPSVPYAWAYLRITGDNGFVHEQDFAAGSSISVSLPRGSIPDGAYAYELTLSSILPGRLDGSRQRDDGQATGSSQSPKPSVTSGTIKVVGGNIVQPVTGADRDPTSKGTTAADQVIADDLIVQGSGCFGFDCINNEVFNLDTIKLKENNLRIKFEDTSADPFPSTDWQLTANDSASGGANKFSIEDITAATIPFTVTGGAPSNSMFVDSSGRLGLKTATPVLELHLNDTDTPAIRLEQNSSGGFSPQTWDIAGNEANFFIRDVTGGSRLPFRIRPDAPTSSIDIAANGSVGMGTASPSAALHVYRTDGTTQLRIQEASATTAGRNMISMFNKGDTRIRMDNGTSAWHLASTPTDFRIAAPLASNQLILTTAGNMTITGTLTQGSSRSIKDNLVPLDARAILGEIASLSLFSWNYKNSTQSDRHVGPVAEDFHTKFRLGTDDKHIAPSDIAGIALAATKALNEIVIEKDAEIQSLKDRLSRLESLLGGKSVRAKSHRKLH